MARTRKARRHLVKEFGILPRSMRFLLPAECAKNANQLSMNVEPLGGLHANEL